MTLKLLQRHLLGALVAAGVWLGAAPAATAHHGWSSYDATKTITTATRLQSVEWRNPHAAAKVEYEGQTWDVILAPISRMEARGLTRDMLKDGAKVTLEGYPRSDGTPEMRLERITVGGKTVELR